MTIKFFNCVAIYWIWYFLSWLPYAIDSIIPKTEYNYVSIIMYYPVIVEKEKIHEWSPSITDKQLKSLIRRWHLSHIFMLN